MESKTSILKVNTAAQIKETRALLSEYGGMRNLDEALGNFKEELKNLPGEYAPPEGCLLIASKDNETAGCVAYRKIGDRICEMKRLYVKEAYRGKNIGWHLVDEIIREAINTGYEIMRLDTHPWMEQAIGIYGKFGFREIDPYHFNPIKGIRFFELQLNTKKPCL